MVNGAIWGDHAGSVHGEESESRHIDGGGGRCMREARWPFCSGVGETGLSTLSSSEKVLNLITP
jgi:hypothetical protein